MSNINVSTLFDSNNLNNFEKIIAIEPETHIFLLPKKYNAANPYYSTNGDYYLILIGCPTIDSKYYEFIKLYNTSFTNTDVYTISIFDIINDTLNYIGSKRLYHHIYNKPNNAINQLLGFNINLLTLENIEVTGEYITGITIHDESLLLQNFTFQNGFNISFNHTQAGFTHNTINKYYRYPLDTYKHSVPKGSAPSRRYLLSNRYTKYIDYRNQTLDNATIVYAQEFDIAYSENNFMSSITSNTYNFIYINSIVIDPDNEKNICIIHKKDTYDNKLYIDFYNSGICTKKIYTDYMYITHNKDNKFTITYRDGSIYSCKLNFKEHVLYDFKFIKNTYQLYKTGKYQQPVQLKNTSLFFNWTEGSPFNSSGVYYIEQDLISTTARPESHQINNSIIQGGYTTVGYYYQAYGHKATSQLPNYSCPTFYTFKNFTISTKYNLIIPNDLLTEDYIKKFSINNQITNEQSLIYTSNEQALVKINNANDLNELYNDARLIIDEGSVKYYLVKSVFYYSGIYNLNDISITNNITDLNGGFKNINMTETNNIMIKLDKYDIDNSTNEFIFNININYEDLLKYIQTNKFINFVDTINNKYYIQQNGYKFKSLNDLTNNFTNILTNEFKADKIQLSKINQDSTSLRYIDNIIAIQTSIPNKKLQGISHTGEVVLEFNYNFIAFNKLQHSSTSDNSIYKFEITKFIDDDGTTYTPSEVNFQLYSCNEEIAKFFQVIIKAKKNTSLTTNSSLYYNITDYTMENLNIAENSYHIFNNDLLYSYNITDATNLQVSSDYTSLTISDTTANLDIYNINIDTTDIILNSDEYIDIDIELDYTNTNSCEYINNIFYGFISNENLDISINNNNFESVIHYDYKCHTLNIYDINYNIGNFKSFGDFHKKCTLQTSGIPDEQYGNNNTHNLYNLAVFNSNYFKNPIISTRYQYTTDTTSNTITGTYLINQKNKKYLITDTINDKYENIQPVIKKGHTFYTTIDLNKIHIDMTNSNEDIIQLVTFGANYQIVLQRDTTTTDLYAGIKIRPQRLNPPDSHFNKINIISKYNLNGVNLSYLYDGTNYPSEVDMCVNLNVDADVTNYTGESIFINNINKTGDTIINNRLPDIELTPPDPELGELIPTFFHSEPVLINLCNNDAVYTTIPVLYLTNSDTYINNGFFNIKYKHLIDFDYHLNQAELNYLYNNKDSIINTIISNRSILATLYRVYANNNNLFYNFTKSKLNIKLFLKYSTLYIYINNILIKEIEVPDNIINIQSLKLYGNEQSGNKIIKITKNNNILTKRSGIWC